MGLKDLYSDDILNRYAGHSFTETTINSMVLVEFKDAGFAVIAKAQQLDLDDAYGNIREQLGLTNSVLCRITTTQRDALTGILAGTQILNTDTSSVDTYGISDWLSPSLVPRLTAILTTNLTFDTADEEKIVAFDVAAKAYGVTLSGGEIEVASKGRWAGHVIYQINETSDPTFVTWLEVKPFATGVWELVGGMIKTKIKDDTTYTLSLSGTLELEAGDKIRVKGMITNSNDTLVLQNTSETVSLGTLNQPPAIFEFTWVGDKTP
jgi:hypothetical protein